MAWRLIRAWTPNADPQLLMVLAGDEGVVFHRTTALSEGGIYLEVVAANQSVERIVALMEKTFSPLNGFHVVVQAVEGIVPQPPDEEDLELHEESEKGPPTSVEELYEWALKQVDHGATYIIAVAVAAVVAATGVLRDSTELIVASMVIAPLLGPSMALGLATTLGDVKLLRKSLMAHTIGIVIALAVSVVFGAIFGISLEQNHVESRLTIGVLDFAIAAAAGLIGALSTVKRSISGVVGVMIAVALLPPMVVTGMMLGAGNFYLAIGPGLLTVTNLICINLVAVIAFRFLSIRPRDVARRGDATRAVIISIGVWVAMIAALVVMLALAPQFRHFP